MLADLVFGQGFLIQRWFLVHRSWCPHKEQGNLSWTTFVRALIPFLRPLPLT